MYAREVSYLENLLCSFLIEYEFYTRKPVGRTTCGNTLLNTWTVIRNLFPNLCVNRNSGFQIFANPFVPAYRQNVDNSILRTDRWIHMNAKKKKHAHTHKHTAFVLTFLNTIRDTASNFFSPQNFAWFHVWKMNKIQMINLKNKSWIKATHN